jgi:hypothetical protein
MFVGKIRNLPYGGAPERYCTQLSSGLTHIHRTGLVHLAKEKHSTLFRKLVNYGSKMFITLGTGSKCNF